ncbi:DUF2213 domain-containing protein [Lichenihabitans psoromatis]|uniref:DUF2213 domain-containing protein n=1 Tax=Lichenihabitans psoromatis TaxID=2528642 RepID=UPI0010360A98|nr:DUF2213 domain-containing protein [Lichenihabitans psoromatis]
MATSILAARSPTGEMMLIRDTAAATSSEVTPEGFLRVRARIGRAGIQDYRAAEIGSPDGFEPGDLVRVYRSPEEVFHPDSLRSFAGKPITDDHPPAMVDAANWKRYAIGHAGHEVTQDGEHLAADLLIADAAGAKRAQAGAELSTGYFADVIFGQGVTPEGEPYDAVQRNIRGNHIALVKAGRCGETCRVGDTAIADCRCGGVDTDSSMVDELHRRLADRDALQSEALAAADDRLAAARAQILDDAAIDALVAERTTVIDVAKRVLGTSLATTGISVADLRRQVVARVLGPERVRDRADPYVVAAFETLVAARTMSNPLAAHLASGIRDAAQTRETALAARNRYLSSAWKGDVNQGDL